VLRGADLWALHRPQLAVMACLGAAYLPTTGIVPLWLRARRPERLASESAAEGLAGARLGLMDRGDRSVGGESAGLVPVGSRLSALELCEQLSLAPDAGSGYASPCKSGFFL